MSAKPFSAPGLTGIEANSRGRKTTGADAAASFQEILKNAIADANEMDLRSARQFEKVVSGKSENLRDAKLALEESRLALQFVTEVRDKVIEAYKEIMHMQL
jgi:flagellar hook-basal body complex protein FliE